jgi:hypothetical protein
MPLQPYYNILNIIEIILIGHDMSPNGMYWLISVSICSQINQPVYVVVFQRWFLLIFVKSARNAFTEGFMYFFLREMIPMGISPK